ncbi:MAG: hypothetical protein OEZ43_14355 [Gammaproteobacteria bacterium]|nr:hypothetical protein [Gammaproteobacteria bacterium]
MDEIHTLFGEYLAHRLEDDPEFQSYATDFLGYIDSGELPQREDSLHMLQHLMYEMFNDPDMTDYLVNLDAHKVEVPSAIEETHRDVAVAEMAD